MNLKYIFLRRIRRILPETITRSLLRRGIFIKPGLETREPHEAALRYRDALREKGIHLQGKHILVFGYGGRFAIGVELLRLGAAHVTLTDLFAPPDERRNDFLLPEFSDYLERVNGLVAEDSESGRRFSFRARAVAQATGAWADELRKKSGLEHIRPLRGSHLLLPARCLPVAQAISFMHPGDGREEPAVLLLANLVLSVPAFATLYCDTCSCGHADDDSQHGKERAHLVAQDGLESHLNRLHQISPFLSSIWICPSTMCSER